MKTLATAIALATVLTIPTSAKTLLKNPQRLLPDYVSTSGVNGSPSPYIDLWTEGYPAEQMGQSALERVGSRARDRW
jgi:hypothetical protein